jgi:hypothetical protein
MAQYRHIINMYEAIPFIVLQDGKYVVVEKALHFLANLKRSIGIISIAGKYRTGKSFILNRCILNEPFQQGFNVGSTIQACTKGIWLYTKTITCVDKEGSSFECVVMDTEGIGALDANSTHDSRIFALALLLSSFFIYNSAGSIDESAVSNLSLVSNISKHIKIHSDKESSNEELGEYLPHFMWMVRDFSLRLVNSNGECIDSDNYLEDALKGDDKVREALRNSFPHRQCVTLVRPCVDENDLQLMDKKEVQLRPAFVDQMQEVRKQVHETVPRKELLGRLINGPMLGQLAQCYTEAINSGVAPVIKDSWELLSEAQCSQVLDESMEMFSNCVSQYGLSVLPVAELESLVSNWIDQSQKYFNEHCTEAFRVKYNDKLKVMLILRKSQLHKTNLFAGDKLMYEMINQMNDTMSNISTIAEAYDVYTTFRAEIVEQLGEDWVVRWKSLVAENMWTWIKVITRQLGDSIVNMREKFHMSQNSIKSTEDELYGCKQQMLKITQSRQNLISELGTKVTEYEKDRANLESQVREQIDKLKRVELDFEASKELNRSEENKAIQDVKDEYDNQVNKLETELTLLQDDNCVLQEDKCVLQDALESRSQVDKTHSCTVASLEISIRKQEESNLQLTEMQNKLSASENRIHSIQSQMEVWESDFDVQISDLNKSSNETITEVRNSFLSQRASLMEEINTLKLSIQKETNSKALLIADHARQVRILESQVSTSQNMEEENTERYKRDLESSRQELARMSKQWENQKDSHRDIVTLLESHWHKDVDGRRKELEELRAQRKSEELELRTQLRDTETELVSQQTLLKDNKRKLVDAEERAGNKKLKSEHDEIKLQYTKATVQLEWLKKSDRDAQENIKDLRVTNLKLERKCKDIQREREVDLLNLKLEYEKKIAMKF